MTEKNLIFLISQPRSGSTLTQKIIGSHSEIYTRGEPWIMLPPAYSLKEKGSSAEYDTQLQQKAFSIFVEDLPEGWKTYLDELRKMYLNLYSSYLEGTKYNYFLDKTPRYHLITDELQKIFPKAHFILLIRNPLAVLGSMIKTWTKSNWDGLSNMKYDLVDAVETNIKILDNQKDKFLIIYYEKLISESEKVFQKVFNHLNVPYESETLNFNNQKNEKWTFGDPENVYEKKGIDRDNDIKWQEGLDDPQYWRVMYDYLTYIGKDKFTKLGYDFDLNMNILKNTLPAKTLDELITETSSLFSYFIDSNELDMQSGQKNNKFIKTEIKLKQKNNECLILEKKLKHKENELKNIYSSKKWKVVQSLASIRNLCLLKNR